MKNVALLNNEELATQFVETFVNAAKFWRTGRKSAPRTLVENRMNALEQELMDRLDRYTYMSISDLGGRAAAVQLDGKTHMIKTSVAEEITAILDNAQ